MRYSLILHLPETPELLRLLVTKPPELGKRRPSRRVRQVSDVVTGDPILVYASRSAPLRTIDRSFRRFSKQLRAALPTAGESPGPWAMTLHIPPGAVDLDALRDIEWGVSNACAGSFVRIERDETLTPTLARIRLRHQTLDGLVAAFQPVCAAVAAASDDLPYAVSLFRRATLRDPNYRAVWIDGARVCVRRANGSTFALSHEEFIVRMRTILHHIESRP